MPGTLKHLLLATTEDPSDLKSWSGIPYSLRTALERQLERVSVFRPPRPRRAPLDVFRRVLFGAAKFPLWITEATLKQNAKALRAEIRRTAPDAVLSISSQCVVSLFELGSLPAGLPVFLFSDAPYQAFCETYEPWESAPRRLPQFTAAEAAAAQRLAGLCFGSTWACDEAARLYSLSGDAKTKLHVTQLGANWTPTASRSEIERRIEARIAARDAQIDLLYLGKDWERKGGPLAVEIAQLLRRAGIGVRLHVVGCRPELPPESTAFVTVHGPLYRNDAAQSAELADLFLRSYFLVVPTLAECFGIVFAEAHAFGLPPVSRLVHALPSIVLDGKTGLLLPPEAPASAYVDRMLVLLRDPDAYREMAWAARERYETSLTWDRTAESIIAAIDASLEEAPQ